ncbi:hypothetical protein RAJCM14343_3035 [Rhodococcus aetherivorans]|uniref:Uncharacterized protein n=1 Tax=Rhodococcus aetherivorans TaxID=191292 RepID=A0ABQ0YMI3_9NOCA|nr:hypothetical protein RAJCM14343_3035 [Rhodococcus aetherivorans]CCW09488.1 hypothetical protein EBESD8_140 [Rhodococcus aetherivorans]
MDRQIGTGHRGAPWGLDRREATPFYGSRDGAPPRRAAGAPSGVP